MWLNTIFLGIACLFTGFVVGWVCGRPRRWDRYVWAQSSETVGIPATPGAPAPGPAGASGIPEPSGPDEAPPLPGGVTTGDQAGD